jgi:hypothetical protein
MVAVYYNKDVRIRQQSNILHTWGRLYALFLFFINFMFIYLIDIL